MSEQRHFTRKDVADYVQQTHPAPQGYEMTIQQVKLLLGITVDIPPLWEVVYTMRTAGEEGRAHELTDIIVETRLFEEWRLLPLIGREIPTGYATVAEEDAAIQAMLAAEQAKWNPKHNKE